MCLYPIAHPSLAGMGWQPAIAVSVCNSNRRMCSGICITSALVTQLTLGRSARQLTWPRSVRHVDRRPGLLDRRVRFLRSSQFQISAAIRRVKPKGRDAASCLLVPTECSPVLMGPWLGKRRAEGVFPSRLHLVRRSRSGASLMRLLVGPKTRSGHLHTKKDVQLGGILATRQ